MPFANLGAVKKILCSYSWGSLLVLLQNMPFNNFLRHCFEPIPLILGVEIFWDADAQRD